jgi:hypothetical protein
MVYNGDLVQGRLKQKALRPGTGENKGASAPRRSDTTQHGPKLAGQRTGDLDHGQGLLEHEKTVKESIDAPASEEDLFGGVMDLLGQRQEALLIVGCEEHIERKTVAE